jgi:hypothetical protein
MRFGRNSSISNGVFLLFLAMTTLLLPFTAGAAKPFGQLDVPFVPTPEEVVERMLKVANVQPSDFVIDLGSGDGRIAIAAVRDFGARGALGIDIDPDRISEARANAEQANVADRVKFENQDLFETDFSKASVLTMYLLPDVNLKLRPKVLNLTPGTRVVSHAFHMGDWESDAYERVGTRSVYLWIVPANVEGQWDISGPNGDVSVALEQAFQNVQGSAQLKGQEAMPVNGHLRGADIRFSVGNGDTAQKYVGRVRGDTMVAVAEAGAVQGWRASRR